jgi:hypothetical protein
VCVLVFLYFSIRLTEHVLMTRVLRNSKDYKTPGEEGPWVFI